MSTQRSFKLMLAGLDPSLRWDDECLSPENSGFESHVAPFLLNNCLTECHEPLTPYRSKNNEPAIRFACRLRVPTSFVTPADLD
jgi:hypothetical protein